MSKSRLCPRDNTPLTPTRFMNLIMDACPQCDGTWLDKGELASILGTPSDLQPASGLQQDDPRGAADCPGCGARMIARWFSSDRRVLVDRCPACWGIWLDQSELQTIMREKYQQERQVTVYVSARGRRYHRESCASAGSASPLKQQEAVSRGFLPCRSCRPDRT
ncbi:MAG: zf-TFIIB domain-containing protein [Candidatus Eremiobacterota bacterium]